MFGESFRAGLRSEAAREGGRVRAHAAPLDSCGSVRNCSLRPRVCAGRRALAAPAVNTSAPRAETLGCPWPGSVS